MGRSDGLLEEALSSKHEIIYLTPVELFTVQTCHSDAHRAKRAIWLHVSSLVALLSPPPFFCSRWQLSSTVSTAPRLQGERYHLCGHSPAPKPCAGMASLRREVCFRALIIATLYLGTAFAQTLDNDCPEAEDFPVFDIPFEQSCSSPSDCAPGVGCEQLFWRYNDPITDGPVCSDQTAGFLDDCDNPNGPRMASPGCRTGERLECDVEYNTSAGELISAVCRSIIGGQCSVDSDCVGGAQEAPDVRCVNGACEEYGFIGECTPDQRDQRCAGGGVCSSRDNSVWIDGSTATYGCFSRAARGEPCKLGFPAHGYKCKDESETAELGYKLICDGAEELDNQSQRPGVCKSYTYEEGAPCNENILCNEMDCVNGVCTRRDVAPGDECSTGSDCRGWNDGVAPDTECSNGRCVSFGYVGSCFSEGDVCPGGQTCWLVGFSGNNRGSCINRAGKGEACKSPRWGPFNGYACKPKSETGYDMRCVFGDDAVGLPGPGPGGAGGGIAGTGLCMEQAAEGAACDPATFVDCFWGGECVDGVCRSQ